MEQQYLPHSIIERSLKQGQEQLKRNMQAFWQKDGKTEASCARKEDGGIAQKKLD